MFSGRGWDVLNDLKDWAIEKGQETTELAQGVANEVQTTSAMDWSGTVWLVLGGIALLVFFGVLSSRS